MEDPSVACSQGNCVKQIRRRSAGAIGTVVSTYALANAARSNCFSSRPSVTGRYCAHVNFQIRTTTGCHPYLPAIVRRVAHLVPRLSRDSGFNVDHLSQRSGGLAKAGFRFVLRSNHCVRSRNSPVTTKLSGADRIRQFGTFHQCDLRHPLKSCHRITTDDVVRVCRKAANETSCSTSGGTFLRTFTVVAALSRPQAD